MRGTPVYVGESFTGGLNTRDSAYNLPFEQARDLLNVVSNVNGALRKRDGTVAFAQPPVALTSVAAIDTPTRGLIAQGGTAFYSIDPGGAVIDITGTTIPTAGGWTLVQAPAITGQGPVYLSNGVDAPQQWTGSGQLADWTAVSGTLPNGRWMKVIGNRVFSAGLGSYPGVPDPGSTLVFSDIGDPRAWPAANIVEFDPNDGDTITGLGTVGPYLLVFKRRKTWVVTDLDTGANRRLSGELGCVAGRSIIETPLGTFFLTQDQGVYLTNGSSLEAMSDVIRPTLDGIVETMRSSATGAFVNNRYYLSVALTSGSQNDTTLDYDTQLKSWWKHSFAASQFAVWRPVANSELHGAAAGVARADRFLVPGESADNGGAFPAYWTGDWMNPSYFRRRIINSSDIRQRLRQVRFMASGALSLNLASDFASAFSPVASYDFTGGSHTWGDATLTWGDASARWGDNPQTVQGSANNLGVHRAFSLQWYSNSTQPWQLEQFMVATGQRAN